eukprot:2728065-Prymnesium_polylepis.1
MLQRTPSTRSREKPPRERCCGGAASTSARSLRSSCSAHGTARQVTALCARAGGREGAAHLADHLAPHVAREAARLEAGV